MTELTNSTEIFNNRLDHAEERIRELEGRSFEISQLQKQKEKRSKEWRKPMWIMGHYQTHEQSHNVCSRRRERERENLVLLKEILNFFKRMNSWKLTKSWESYGYPGTVSSKNSKQDQPKDYSKAHNMLKVKVK